MKTNIRLGVNIDHVATVRNARGENYPSPLRAALIAQKCKANSVTIHLREDRRHIKDSDLKIIKKKLRIPLNLEIAATNEMLKIALKHKPNFICLVPEKRKEITTEGGLNLEFKTNYLKKFVTKIKKYSRVSLFIEPDLKSVTLAKMLQADCVEFHTGVLCKLVNEKKLKSRSFKNEILKLQQAVQLANNLNLEVHAGHGLTFESAKILKKINGIEEYNIGHFLIGESIFEGLSKTIKKFKSILN